MCDEKRIVTSVLRALLISKGNNEHVTLKELTRDYCLQEGKKEIPKFGHNNVADFLLRSGEFFLNFYSGETTVREKPKSESLHIKKLVLEQRPCIGPRKCTSFEPLGNNINRKIVPVHANKPSVIFNFDELHNSLSNDIDNANLIETSSLHSQDEIRSQPDRCIRAVHEGESTTSCCFDTLKDEEAKSFCDASRMTNNCKPETTVDARLQLLDVILPFNVVKDCRGGYSATIIVEGREYTALGESEASAKDKVAETVFGDEEIMLLIKLRSSNEWKLNGIVNGLHKVTVKIDGNVYDGEGYDSQSAVGNCIENALKSYPHTIQSTSSLKILTEKCVGLSYKTISSDSDEKYKVMMQLDGVSYFGEGQSVQEANENAANECLKFIFNGDHHRSIDARSHKTSTPNVTNGSFLQSNHFNPQERYSNFNYSSMDVNAIRTQHLLQHLQRAHLHFNSKRC